ncbi:MAG: BON domain-containing protein [Bacillota bacterium]
MTKDDKIKAQIENLLKSEMYLVSALGINVEVEKGYVKLQGIVDTLAEGEYAADLIKKIPSVKGVDNGLTVAMDNFDTDEHLTDLVMERLHGEPDLDIKKIGAECHKGVVILRGQASSLGEIELARELAAQVPGVREVKTLVKFTEEAKETVESNIVNAVEVGFAASEIVEAEDVLTSCTKGIVTLEGTVDTNEQKEAAESIAKTIPGVRKVINKLDSRHETQDQDAHLTNVLRKALNTDPRVSPAQVKAYVLDGTAYLSGKVYGIDAKKAAEEVARKMKGIKQVMNDVTVAYH